MLIDYYGTPIDLATLTPDLAEAIMDDPSLDLSVQRALYRMKVRGKGPWSKDPTPTPEPTPEPTPTPDNSWEGYKARHDGEAVRKAVNEEMEYLRSLGLSPKEPLYDPSTGLVEWGVENFNQSLRDWEALPSAAEAFKATADYIKAEAREDYNLSTKDLRLEEDSGGLILNAGQGVHKWRLTEHALRRLLSTSLEGVAVGPRWSFTRSMTREELIPLVNSRLSRLPEMALTARTRRSPSAEGEREAWAVVSPKYGAFDGDRVLEIAARHMEGTAYKGRAFYDANTSSLTFEAWIHAQDVSKVGPGSAFKAGFGGSTADNGSQGFKASREIIRNLCLNLIILDTIRQDNTRIVHRGRNTGDQIRGAITKALTSMEKDWSFFAERWGLASRPDSLAVAFEPEVKRHLGGKDPEPHEILTLVAEGKILAAGEPLGKRLPLDRDALVEALLGSWSLEPGGDLEAITNAVTRLHEKVPVGHLADVGEWGGAFFTERASRVAASLRA